MLHEREFGRNDSSVVGPRDGPFNPTNNPLHDVFGRDDPRDLSYQVQIRDLHKDAHKRVLRGGKRGGD
jgi:hypothetical protein